MFGFQILSSWKEQPNRYIFRNIRNTMSGKNRTYTCFYPYNMFGKADYGRKTVGTQTSPICQMSISRFNKSTARGAMIYFVVSTNRLPPSVNPVSTAYIRITYRTFHGTPKLKFNNSA